MEQSYSKTGVRARKGSPIKMTASDRIFNAFNISFWVLVLFVTLYPLYFILISSFSEPYAVLRGEVVFWPRDPSLIGYEAMFKFGHFWRAYLNSVVYTVSGTALSVAVTLMAGYALSNKFTGKPVVNFLIIFQMFFSGGLIPTFLLMRDIGLYNNPLMMVFSGCVSVWNLMITRTYMTSSIPRELYEAASIDGATHIKYFVSVVLPLSGTITAVLCVYYGVANWNNFMTALIYIRDRRWYPVTLVLREILAKLTMDAATANEMYDEAESVTEAIRVAEVVKYCAIVMSTGPAVILYVNMQKFFVKGVMIGSLKG
ncbi:MAG: carbohydrate ABC transporter permease [Christensenellales bacterium]|jgi:putative aldouronate transport system permease protein